MKKKSKIMLMRMMSNSKGGGDNPWERYNQDGLVFQLDCQKDCTAEKWTDLIGGIEFDGTGVTLDDNGIPYFNGSAQMVAGDIPLYKDSECTIEVYIDKENTKGTVFASSNEGNIVCAYNSAIFHLCSQGSSLNIAVDVSSFTASNAVSYNKNITCVGGVAKSSELISGEYNYSNINAIGYSPDCKYFVGRIYAIRIYNRLLTADEMIANQAIDLERFENL